MFEIYSLGDGLFMKRVLDGVAMMSNEGFLLALGGFGMLLGLLMVGLKAIESGGQKVELPNLFVSFLLVLGMFSIKVDTTIHAMDGAPGANVMQTYTVDNVPVGVALPATVVSTLGKVITEKMQTAFSVPGMEDFNVESGQFGNTLKVVDMARRWDLDGLKGRNGAVVRFKDNLRSYYAGCTIPGIARGAIDPNEVASSPTPLTLHDEGKGIGFEDVNTDILYATASGQEQLNCRDAMTRLRVDSIDAGMMESFLTSAMALTDARGNGTDPVGSATSAFQAIGGGSNTIHGHVMASAVSEIMDEALAGNTTFTPEEVQAQLMLIQGNRQRQDEWGAGEIMFRKAMRPFMAFLECVVFIAAPFMALIAGMGTLGQRVVAKYFTITLWVTTWAPMFAAVELFQLTMVQHAVAAIERLHDTAHGAPISSIAGAAAVNSEITTWIAVGGWMATLVPPLGYLLLSGGAVAMTSFAGRLGGGDHINEKTTSPDLVKMGEAMSVSNRLSHSMGTGTQVSGNEDFGGKVSFQSTSTSGVESAAAHKREASAAAGRVLSNIASSSWSETSGVTTGSAVNTSRGNSVESGMGVTQGQSTSTNVGDTADRSKDTASSKFASAAAGAKLGTGGGGGAGGEGGDGKGGLASAVGKGLRAVGLDVGAQIGVRDENRESSSFGNKASFSKADEAAKQAYDRAGTTEQKLEAISRAASEGSSWARSVQDQYSRTNEAKDLQAASQAYTEKSSNSNAASSLSGTSMLTLAEQIDTAGGTGEAVKLAIETGGYQAYAMNKAWVEQSAAQGKVAAQDDERVQALAAAITLNGTGQGAVRLNAGSEDERREALGYLANQYGLGAPGGGYGNAQQFEHLKDETPKFGEATSEVGNVSSANIPSRGEVIRGVQGDIAQGSGADIARVQESGRTAESVNDPGVRPIVMDGIYQDAAGGVESKGSENLGGVAEQTVGTAVLNQIRGVGDFWGGGQTDGSTLHAVGRQYVASGDGSIPESTGDYLADKRSGQIFMVDQAKAEVGESGASRFQEIKEDVIRNSGHSRGMVDDDAAAVIAAAQYAQEQGAGTPMSLGAAYLNAEDAAEVEGAMRGLTSDQKQQLFGMDAHTNDSINVSGGDSSTNGHMGAALLKRDP